MILGDVEEVITTVEIDDETYEEIVRVRSLLTQYDLCLMNIWWVNIAHVIENKCLLAFIYTHISYICKFQLNEFLFRL